jgi:hypothetical protein
MKSILTLTSLVFSALPGLAAVILELEENNTKATANAVALLTGDSIRGNTTGISTTDAGAASADNFRITIGGLAPGIYRHRLVITSGIAGHTGTIRGLTQTAGVPNVGTDATVQTSNTATTPARFNQFYGFGDPSAELFYRVTGGAATTADYDSTLETEAVTPVSIGTFNPGFITISTSGLTTADTDIWVYAGTFAAIPGYGNDDNSILGGGTDTGNQSILNRTYAPGKYYLAISNFNLANNLGSPDDDRYRAGGLLDGNFIANSSTSINVNLDFSISDGTTTTPVTSLKTGAYDINWYSFDVVPEPSSAIFGLVGMTFLCARRTRRSSAKVN